MTELCFPCCYVVFLFLLQEFSILPDGTSLPLPAAGDPFDLCSSISLLAMHFILMLTSIWKTFKQNWCLVLSDRFSCYWESARRMRGYNCWRRGGMLPIVDSCWRCQHPCSLHDLHQESSTNDLWVWLPQEYNRTAHVLHLTQNTFLCVALGIRSAISYWCFWCHSMLQLYLCLKL